MKDIKDILDFVIPKNKSSIIKVIGVGGGGGNAVNNMYRQGITGVDFLVCNTDAQALDASPVPNKIQLGKGLGAGNVPAVAEKAAMELKDVIKAEISHNTKMLFITAGMGGGTGTGAAPVIAEIAKEIELDDEVNKILTVAIVTTPFSFEGRKRAEQAKQGIEALRKHVDAVLVISNDKLREFGDMPMKNAFAMVDDVLTAAAKGISEIITVSSYIQIDFRDVNTVMANSGVALMGFGVAEGEDRARLAIEQAMSSPLLADNSVDGAKNVLLYMSSSSEHEIRMDEITIITDLMKQETGGKADVIWGAGEDDKLGEKLSITLVATGFTEAPSREFYTLGEENTQDLQPKNTFKSNLVTCNLGSYTDSGLGTAGNEGLDNLFLKENAAPESHQNPVDLLYSAMTDVLQFKDEDIQIDSSIIKLEPEDIKDENEIVRYELDADYTTSDNIKENNSDNFDAEKLDTKNDAESAQCADIGSADVNIIINSAEDMPIEEIGNFHHDINLEEEKEVSNTFNSEFLLREGIKSEVSHTSNRGTLIDVVEMSEKISSTIPSSRILAMRSKLDKFRYNNLLKTPEGLMQIEKIPAYKRINTQIDEIVESSVSEVGKASVGLDGSIQRNKYLYDNVD